MRFCSPLALESRPLITYITPFGRFFYERIRYGISSAPEQFQKKISALLQGKIDGVVCLLDDILLVRHDQ